MKVWERVRIEQRCGFCGHRIPIGAPTLVRWVAGHGWRKIRCVECAGEPVPDNLPSLTEIVSRPMTPLDMTRIGLLALDYSRQREPGQEG